MSKEKIEIEDANQHIDKMKWAGIFLILLITVVANNVYNESSILLRVIFVIIAIAGAFGIAYTTNKGKEGFEFLKEARLELYKIVWPTRQEAIHTTLVVLAATAISGLILWGLDGILVRLIAFITGVSL